MQLLVGAQILFLFFALASGFHQITGAGTAVSMLIGGFGGVAALYAIYRRFPKSVLGLATGAWAIGGLMLGNAVFGTAGATLILVLLGAAFGFAVNIAWLSGLDAQLGNSDALVAPFQSPALNASDREGLVVLWHAVRRLDRMKVIDAATFKRLNGFIAGLLQMPNPPEGSAPRPTIDVADGFQAVRQLQDNSMISEAEAEAIRARIEARENDRSAPRAPEAPRLVPDRAPMGLNPDGSLTESEREILAAYLPKLVENRALSLASFLRLKAVLEPGFVGSDLTDAAFPFEDSADADDLETVERLHKAGLIDATEYRRGLQVILPYLHKSA